MKNTPSKARKEAALHAQSLEDRIDRTTRYAYLTLTEVRALNSELREIRKEFRSYQCRVAPGDGPH